MAYRKAGVPRARVFLVNFDGELQSLNQTFRKSYSNMSDELLDQIFPPYSETGVGAEAVSDQFADVNYWREPLPDIDSDSDEC